MVIGLDVSKHDHHTCGLEPSDVGVLDDRVDAAETALRKVLGWAARDGRVMVLVDQLHSIGALLVTVGQSPGINPAHLPGLSMRPVADLHPGNTKIDAWDAYVTAN